jgi:transcriptional antiterminator RfaH
VAYWAVAQLQPQREAFALSMLSRADFQVYAPRLREWRAMPFGGPLRQRELPLFPGYTFLLIQLQWHAARWCPGVVRLVMDGLQPAKVPDAVIDEIRSRQHKGAIELPKRMLKSGDRVRILAGPFKGHLAIYASMSAHERVAVLLQILGAATRVMSTAEQSARPIHHRILSSARRPASVILERLRSCASPRPQALHSPSRARC